MEKAELRQLAARASEGESSAWDALYREISAIAAFVCKKNSLSPEDAEDVTQETTLAISNRLKEIAHMDNPEGYIRRVINSKCVDIIRSGAKAPVERMHENEDYVLNLPDASATPENEVAGFSPDRLINDFISELPEDQRLALKMRYYDGYTNAQIAKKLSVPSGTVASRVRYGKKSLEKRIVQYEKENNIRLHAKIALPFLPLRMFRNQALKTAEIIASDGGSSFSGGARAATGLLATVVLGGAVIGTGFVLQGNNTPTAEIVPTQAVTEQIEPTAATVYEDIYETQVETVYETINSAQQTAQDNSPLPNAFQFAGNRFLQSEDTLTSKTYHAGNLGATLTFPDSWINNVTVSKSDNYVSINDRSSGDNQLSEYTGLMNISSNDINKKDFRDEFEPPVKNYDGTYEAYYFKLGYSELPGKDNYRVYSCSLNWNRSIVNKTNLDYSNINRDVLSVLESFRPDGLSYTSLLTQQKKEAVMKITDFRIQTP